MKKKKKMNEKKELQFCRILQLKYIHTFVGNDEHDDK